MSPTAIILMVLLGSVTGAIVTFILCRHYMGTGPSLDRWIEDYRREIEVCNAQYRNQRLQWMDRNYYGTPVPSTPQHESLTQSGGSTTTGQQRPPPLVLPDD